MTTTQMPALTGTYTYTIVEADGYFYIDRNGVYLTDRNGRARVFATRVSARKRISRERRGNFHQ